MNEFNNFNWVLLLKCLVLLKGKFFFINLWYLCLLWFIVVIWWICFSFWCGCYEGIFWLVFWDLIFLLLWYGCFGRKLKLFLYFYFNYNIILKFVIFFLWFFLCLLVKILYNEEIWGFFEGNDVFCWFVIFWNVGYLINN